MDQKKSDRKTFFLVKTINSTWYLMGQKNTFSDNFFPEEALSEEQLIRKSGKKRGISYHKNS